MRGRALSLPTLHLVSVARFCRLDRNRRSSRSPRVARSGGRRRFFLSWKYRRREGEERNGGRLQKATPRAAPSLNRRPFTCLRRATALSVDPPPHPPGGGPARRPLAVLIV